MEGGNGAPVILDASQSLPKDVILDEGIDLIAECGRLINDRFERARTASPNPIWTDPEEPNYEGMTMAVDDPRGLRQEGSNQFHIDNRLGSTRVIKQPKGGDGTEWE